MDIQEMSLQQLVQERHNINCEILNIVQADVIGIKLAAENMIECATNIKGQGYSMFINSREVFLEKIDSLQNQIHQCMNINNCTQH